MIGKPITFRGKKISDMSKEELVVAVYTLSNIIHIETNEHNRQLESLSSLRARRNRGMFGRIVDSIFGG